MGLKWVNKFISVLGGDPKHVTISGCSAGAQSTMVHLTSPESWPYFTKVVAFSAPNGLEITFWSLFYFYEKKHAKISELLTKHLAKLSV